MANCEECQAAFSELDNQDDRLRAQWLDRHQPQCRCQRISVSHLSPGPVTDDEVLIRVLVAPQHIHKKKNRPVGAALSAAELSGLSLMRENHATDDAIRTVAARLVEQARASQSEQSGKVGVFGVLQMRCGVIRASKATDEEMSAYCVYDTALPQDVSHAEAFQRVDGMEQEMILSRRRELLSQVEASFIPVAEFRGGLLNHLAPREPA